MYYSTRSIFTAKRQLRKNMIDTDKDLHFIGFNVLGDSVLCTGSIESLSNFSYLQIQGLVEHPSWVGMAGTNTEDYNDRNFELISNCDNNSCVDLSAQTKAIGTYPIASIQNNKFGGGYLNKILPEKRLDEVNKILALLGIRRL
jgi:hypothetical protein